MVVVVVMIIMRLILMMRPSPRSVGRSYHPHHCHLEFLFLLPLPPLQLCLHHPPNWVTVVVVVVSCAVVLIEGTCQVRKQSAFKYRMISS